MGSRNLLFHGLVLLVYFFFACVTANGQSSEDQIAEHFRAGQQAMLHGEFTQATEEFKKVLTLDPTLVEAEVNLGLAYQSLFEYESAVRHLSKALLQRPNLLIPNVIVGADYLKLGYPPKAAPYLERALKLDASNREAHQALAQLYLSQGNFQGAAHEFREVAELESDKSEAWFKLGHEYLDLSARLAYRGAHLYKDSAWGHRFLGDLLFERSRWDEAQREYLKALSIDPQQEGLHTSLGQAYLHAGQADRAENEFQSELQRDQTNPSAWLSIAEVRLKQNDPKSAVESVAKAYAIAPEFVALQKEFPSVELTPEAAKASALSIEETSASPAKHFLLASLFSLAGDVANADKYWRIFQVALAGLGRPSHQPETKPNACRSNDYSGCVRLLSGEKALSDSQTLTLGKSELALRQYDSAANSLARIKGVSKLNVEASYWLSKTYQALGSNAYVQLQEKFPDSWRTHQLRGEGYALKRDYDSATREFQAALRLQPNKAELHEAIGELYLDTHAEADAEKELNAALALNPAGSRALYLLARLFVQQSNNEKAVPYLQKALSLQPDFAEASSLLGTAYMRMGRFADAVPRLENATQVDHYGNVHYQLYVAYKKLGKAELAQRALAQSQSIRRSSLERDQALVMGAPQIDGEVSER